MKISLFHDSKKILIIFCRYFSAPIPYSNLFNSAVVVDIQFLLEQEDFVVDFVKFELDIK